MIKLIILGLLILSLCITMVVYIIIEKEITGLMMFTCLAALIAFYGSLILNKLRQIVDKK